MPKNEALAAAKFDIKLAQQHDDIAALYKAGLTPKQINKKYIEYSEQDILLILQEAYSVSNIDYQLLDGLLLKGYLEDMSKVDKDIIGQTKDFDVLLKAYLYKLNARNFLVKFRTIIKEFSSQGTPGSANSSTGVFTDDSPNFGSVEILEEIKRYIKILPPNRQHEATELLENIEVESLHKLRDILKAGVPQENNLIPEKALNLIESDED